MNRNAHHPSSSALRASPHGAARPSGRLAVLVACLSLRERENDTDAHETASRLWIEARGKPKPEAVVAKVKPAIRPQLKPKRGAKLAEAEA